MFYSHSLLAKKSPLGMVWIAAHLQKMKKAQIDGVDIRSSAGEASAGQDHYATFFIDKDNSINSSVHPETRNDAEPMEEEVLPPFDGGLDAIISSALNSASFEGPGSNNHGNDSFKTFDVNNNIQEFQETEVMHENNLEPENQLELDNTSNGVELHDHSTSVTKRKHSLDPILEDILEPLPSTSHAKPPMSTFDSKIAKREICSGQALPHLELELELQASPPVREQKQKRRIKKHSYDDKIVLANADMKKQLEDTNLVCKRRKLPCSVLYLYKYHSDLLNDQVFHEPLLSVISRRFILDPFLFKSTILVIWKFHQSLQMDYLMFPQRICKKSLSNKIIWMRRLSDIVTEIWN